ncbi:fimbrial protein, partial [Gallibacterium anatis DSM 16844 = F 149]
MISADFSLSLAKKQTITTLLFRLLTNL